MLALLSNVENTLAYHVACIKVLGRACTLLDEIQYFCPKLLEFLYKVNTTSKKAEEGKVSRSNYPVVLIRRVHRTDARNIPTYVPLILSSFTIQ